MQCDRHCITQSDTSFDPMSSSFDKQRLTFLLDNDNHEKRQKFKNFFKDPIFIPRFDISLRHERELALERLKRIAEGQFISVFDFEKVILV